MKRDFQNNFFSLRTGRVNGFLAALPPNLSGRVNRFLTALPPNLSGRVNRFLTAFGMTASPMVVEKIDRTALPSDHSSPNPNGHLSSRTQRSGVRELLYKSNSYHWQRSGEGTPFYAIPSGLRIHSGAFISTKIPSLRDFV